MLIEDVFKDFEVDGPPLPIAATFDVEVLLLLESPAFKVAIFGFMSAPIAELVAADDMAVVVALLCWAAAAAAAAAFLALAAEA